MKMAYNAARDPPHQHLSGQMSSEKKGEPSLIDLALMRDMGLLGGNQSPKSAKKAPQTSSGAGYTAPPEVLEAQEREHQRQRAAREKSGNSSHLFRDIVIGAVAGLLVAGGYAVYKGHKADNARTEAFRAAAREATSAIGLGNAVYEVKAPQGACLHWANEARAPINPVQCLPAGTKVRGIVAPPAQTDIAEARQWLLVSLTDTEVKTGRSGTANEFPQGYLIPYGSVRPVTGPAASGAAPK